MAEWFKEWFNSPYYHLLYRDRDHKEASAFIDEIISFTKLEANSSVLDVACGSGRHALHFSKNGFKTMGIDLASNSIKEAKKSESDYLKFQVEDMRDFTLDKTFHLITNLFTSFGYFIDINDNLKALQTIVKHLAKDGLFILDFMNTSKVISNLVDSSEKTIDDTTFYLKRRVEDGIIIKDINFKNSEGEEFLFSEKVQAIFYNDFNELFYKTGLDIVRCFGDYSLTTEYQNDSDRMIFILKEKV